MPFPTPLPPELLGRPFTLDEARELGLNARILRNRRFLRLFNRVYVSAGTPLDHFVLCHAACLAVPHGAISHASAVVIDGLPLGMREPEPHCPHISTAVGLSTGDCAGMVNHVELVPPNHIVSSVLGPVTCAARTYVDRAAVLDLEDVVALGDAILRRGLATAEELAAMVEWARGRRGVARARSALALLDARSKSPMESRTRVLFILGDCPPPEVNAQIFDDLGCWIAEGDLVWREAKLIVEYDGGVHLREEQRRADALRHNLLVQLGWTVIRLTADDVLKRPSQTVAMVANLVASRLAA